MLKYILVLFCFTFSITCTNAQSIKGIVNDENEKLPIAGATVKLANTTNAPLTLVTDKQGTFNFQNVSVGTYTLTVSSIGYDAYVKDISIKDNSINDLGTIMVPKRSKVLNTVTINTTAPPVRQKADTLEYAANSYKVNPDANAEDLLKKMPGVTVDKDYWFPGFGMVLFSRYWINVIVVC